MKKQFVFTAALAVLMAATIFTACKKEEKAATELELQATTTDLATTEDLSESSEAEADLIIEERGGGGPSTGCPTVTSTAPLGTFPNTVTIDFGTDGCTRPNGRTYKGLIIIAQNSLMNASGAVRTVTLQDFSVDDVKIEGQHTATYQGLDSAGLPYWTRTGSKTLTWPDGSIGDWTATHTLTQLEGAATAALADNVWQIEGGCTGTNHLGNDYTSEITKPLVKRADCKWISEGTRTIQQGNRTRTLDFGDGSCDDAATLTLNNGSTLNIKLRG